MNVNTIHKYFSSELGFGNTKSIALELLKETIAFLDEFDIDYFIISGTLLGHIRHNDFIPWDDDIDLIVDEIIFEKLLLITEKYDHKLNFIKDDYIIKTCFPNKHKILTCYRWSNKLLKNNTNYCWPFIDLFTYKKDEGSLQFFNKNWDYKEFFPSKKVSFNNIIVNIPKNPEYFLNLNYGPDFMTELVSSGWNHKTEGFTSGKPLKITMEEYEKYKSEIANF